MSARGKSAIGFGGGCALVVWIGVAAAIAQNANQPLTAGDARTAGYSAPLELIHDKPFVMVTINDRGPFRFLVDTGTGGQAIISPELAHQLALPVAGRARLFDPSGQGEQRSEILLIHSLSIAGVEFSEIKAVRHRLYGVEQNCQGVLGFTLFKDYLLTLDFPGRRLVLAQGSISPDDGGSVLPFRMPDGVPIAPLRIDSQHVEAQIDSGGTGLSLPEPVAAKLKFLSTPIAFGSGESLATKFEIKAARLRPDVRVGRYTFKQPFVEINSAFPLANFGSTPLQHFVITFDQAKLLLRLYSNQKVLHLNASPATMDLVDTPRREAPDRTLVPVG